MFKNLEGLLKEELLEMAKKLRIPDAARLKKSELIHQIKKKQIEQEKSRTTKAKPAKARRRQTPSSLESPLVGKVRLNAGEAAQAKPGFVHPHSEGMIHPPAMPVAEVRREGELPRSYNITKIVLLVRDPYWCYAYWDFGQETRGQIHRWFIELPAPRAVLRVYDVTDVAFDGTNAARSFDIDISFDPGNWYIEVGKPDRDFLVDIGVRDAQGRFYLIARSNVIRTPRDVPSDVIDEEWMAKDFELLYAISGGFKVGSSSAELMEQVKKGVLFRKWISSGAVSSRSS